MVRLAVQSESSFEQVTAVSFPVSKSSPPSISPSCFAFRFQPGGALVNNTRRVRRLPERLRDSILLDMLDFQVSREDIPVGRDLEPDLPGFVGEAQDDVVNGIGARRVGIRQPLDVLDCVDSADRIRSKRMGYLNRQKRQKCSNQALQQNFRAFCHGHAAGLPRVRGPKRPSTNIT